MSNFWHNSILGRYNPTERQIGMDYTKSFLDPIQMDLVSR